MARAPQKNDGGQNPGRFFWVLFHKQAERSDCPQKTMFNKSTVASFGCFFHEQAERSDWLSTCQLTI